jgi:hypothetical protein
MPGVPLGAGVRSQNPGVSIRKPEGSEWRVRRTREAETKKREQPSATLVPGFWKSAFSVIAARTSLARAPGDSCL